MIDTLMILGNTSVLANTAASEFRFSPDGGKRSEHKQNMQLSTIEVHVYVLLIFTFIRILM